MATKKAIKGLLIDPEKRTIEEIELNAGGEILQWMYTKLDCTCADVASGGLDWLPGGCPDDVWFDDEGTFGDPKHFFQLPGWHSIAGRGLILGHDRKNGETISHSLSAMQQEVLRGCIRFRHIQKEN